MSQNRGRGRGGGRGRGRGGGNGGRQSRPTSTKTRTPSKSGADKSLGANVFDTGSKSSADEFATSWEQMIIHVGATLGDDICQELRNNKPVVIPKPIVPPSAVIKYAADKARDAKQKTRSKNAKEAQVTALTNAISKESDLVKGAAMNSTLADSSSEIEELQEQIDNPPPIKLTGEEKTQYEGEYKTYQY